MVRRSATLVFLVCLQGMTWACSSRTTAAGLPVPASADPPAPLPGPVAVIPEAAPTTGNRPDPDTDDCELVAGAGEPVATVALNDRIDPSNAPHPSNDSERLLFRQLYETLVGVDCLGRVVPGLASSWRLDGDGHTWILTLREGARFSDGTPVTAANVKASWSRDGVGDDLRPDVSRLVESIVSVDDRAMAIRLRSTRTDGPIALAHSDLAITKSVADSSWPIGTRSARVEPDGDVRGTSVITVARDDLPSIRFLVAPGDPRDLLDNDVDLLLTRDQPTLAYAATLPRFQSVALDWYRTHVLLMPGRPSSSPTLPDDARQMLAGDAVRGEARGARGPFWWETLTDCEIAATPRNQSSFTPRIVYDASDPAARDLAERLVGLTRASGPAAGVFLDVLLPDRPRRGYQRATGLSGEALAVARRLGTDAAYVLSVDNRPLDPCRDLQVLMDGARWLDPAAIVPLVDTRLHAIVRRGRSGLSPEWDGGVAIAGGGAQK